MWYKVVQGYKFNIFYPDLIHGGATPEFSLVVQGYKFNIFYPDLIHGGATPEFSLVSASGARSV
ncbi:unnamed protein product [Plutella xylostella]|uniref:(diamondback moth) hypothetical protein n=1 Tax=Plutella xylostella TaxID=51655 RepID=A0A8S4GBY0_PLUXY|nr:unnamed protein product [Plutella xylostella]CAG9137228.1 unnamed protein product [Plutella xylostella]CAG9137229.1 unnamed protein product [Plutella xylostella]